MEFCFYLSFAGTSVAKKSLFCVCLKVFPFFLHFAEKYDPVSNTPKANPKIWKANFRCAINSLPDILEVKGQGKSKGNDAFKIYKLIPKKAKKPRTRKSYSWQSKIRGYFCNDW